jgi:hypothetical protein
MNPKKIIPGLAILFLTIRLGATLPVGTCTFVSPCMPFASFSIIANTYACYSFTATNAGASEPNDYYTWNFGDGNTATGIQVLHCYSPVTVTTIYTITVTYVGPVLCGPLPLTSSYTLALNPPPSTLCVVNSPSVTIAAPSVTVWTGITIPEITDEITYGDGTQSTASVTHTYNICGNYIITIKTTYMISPPNICYSYAAVNMNCAIMPTGIDESSTEIPGAVIFPNPANKNINIRSLQTIERVIIRDIYGKEISMSKDLPVENLKEINVSELINGTYFVEIFYDSGHRCAMKFQKSDY